MKAQRTSPMPDAAIAAAVTLRDRLTRIWTDFEAKHRRLVDDLTAAAVGLIAIAFWYVTLALFAH